MKVNYRYTKTRKIFTFENIERKIYEKACNVKTKENYET